MICNKCGTWNEDGNGFCYKCGNPLTTNGANPSMPSMQGVGMPSGMPINGMNNQVMQGNGMNPMMQSNGMNPMVQNGGMNPGMQNNGMAPMMQGNGYAPIKPKKSHTGLIILIAILSVIASGALVFVLIHFVGKSSDNETETKEETVTIESEVTTKDVSVEETEDDTEEDTEKDTEKYTEDDTEVSGTELETLPISSEIYKQLEGGWDAPGDGSDVDGGAYWEFRNGEYWWYKTSEDLTDNYWYGTTEIIMGREGIEMAGLNEAAVDQIFYNSGGTITENDIYTIVCTPKKIISGGVDKSATNIPEGTKLIYVWVLVDEGEDGMWAQTIRLNDYEIYYYKRVTE